MIHGSDQDDCDTGTCGGRVPVYDESSRVIAKPSTAARRAPLRELLLLKLHDRSLRPRELRERSLLVARADPYIMNGRVA
jgi:hypothetical protein